MAALFPAWKLTTLPAAPSAAHPPGLGISTWVWGRCEVEVLVDVGSTNEECKIHLNSDLGMVVWLVRIIIALMN